MVNYTEGFSFQESDSGEGCWLGVTAFDAGVTLAISRERDGDIHVALSREQAAKVIAMIADCLAASA